MELFIILYVMCLFNLAIFGFAGYIALLLFKKIYLCYKNNQNIILKYRGLK